MLDHRIGVGPPLQILHSRLNTGVDDTQRKRTRRRAITLDSSKPNSQSFAESSSAHLAEAVVEAVVEVVLLADLVVQLPLLPLTISILVNVSPLMRSIR